eukprot:1954234-Alexandrium_andersonii.AAC.1
MSCRIQCSSQDSDPSRTLPQKHLIEVSIHRYCEFPEFRVSEVSSRRIPVCVAVASASYAQNSCLSSCGAELGVSIDISQPSSRRP